MNSEILKNIYLIRKVGELVSCLSLVTLSSWLLVVPVGSSEYIDDTGPQYRVAIFRMY